MRRRQLERQMGAPDAEFASFTRCSALNIGIAPTFICGNLNPNAIGLGGGVYVMRTTLMKGLESL